MKKIILITMLMSAVFAQSDCNENNWRDYYNSDGKDMSDCDLRGAHLSGRTFAGANLTGANLTGANLKYANIGEATFEGANLTDAILEEDATLLGANLTNAYLTNADLSSANLRRANLSGANLRRANLTNAELSFADLSSADLSSADLSGANLTYANLTNANLTDVILEGVESDNISGLPLSLPDGWSLVDGTLVEDEETEELTNRELSDEIFRQINEGNAIKKSKWIAWKNENDPQVSKGKTSFKNLDKNNNGKISSGEFFKFYKRWIQD